MSLEIDHLSCRPRNVLKKLGLLTKAQVRTAIRKGKLDRCMGLMRYGILSHVEVCQWLKIKLTRRQQQLLDLEKIKVNRARQCRRSRRCADHCTVVFKK